METLSAKIGIYSLGVKLSHYCSENIVVNFYNMVNLKSKSIQVPFKEITGIDFQSSKFENVALFELGYDNIVNSLQNYLLKLLLSKNIEVLLSVYIHVNSTEKVYLHSHIGDSNLRFSTEFKSHKISNIEQWQFIESYSFDYTFKVESDESVKLLRGKTK